MSNILPNISFNKIPFILYFPPLNIKIIEIIVLHIL